MIFQELGRRDQAQAQFEADLALRRELIAKAPANRSWQEYLGTSHQYLGVLLLQRGDAEAATPHLEAARERFQELVTHDPENGDWLFKHAVNDYYYGRLQELLGNPIKAREARDQAYTTALELERRSPDRTDWQELLDDASRAVESSPVNPNSGELRGIR